MAFVHLLLLLEPQHSAVLQAESPVELPEEYSVPVGVQLAELAGLVGEQLELEALDSFGLTVLASGLSPVAVLATLAVAVATAAGGLLQLQLDLVLAD